MAFCLVCVLIFNVLVITIWSFIYVRYAWSTTSECMLWEDEEEYVE